MNRHYPKLAEKKKCTGCLACVDSCKYSALHHYVDNDGHYYIKINKDSCIGCLMCEKTCPVVSDIPYAESECADFYAAWNINDEERVRSASGGVFAAMAHYVLNKGGIAVGAAMENICDVKHVAINRIEDIGKLQGSKYTQSCTEGIYKETFDYLKHSKIVLFSGTGCQVAGLLSYLKKKQYIGKLITVDLICGGVPSKLLLNKFIENEPYEIKKILSYRTKEHGWKPKGFVYNMKVEDSNGIIHDYTRKRNLVTTGFSTEMTERYSCYNCKFVGKKRRSDFTIGDLWGDTEFPQEHYKGLSLVVAHNRRAKELLQEMKTYLHVVPYNEVEAAKVNFRLENGRSVKQYTVERKYLNQLFYKCSYKTLKKIYANDFKVYSLWMAWKVIRIVYLKIITYIVKK